MRKFVSTLAAAAVVALSAVHAVQAADPVKIAFIDPLSGPFAPTGTNGLAEFKFAAEELVNKEGGVLDGRPFEIVPFDNKISAKESLIQLQVAIDQGIRDVMANAGDVKKVYIIGQDYSFGKAVAAAAVDNIAKKMPEAEIVGNELHPIGKVKDFTPYARKIVNSGADAIITGNWGADMVGLGKAVIEGGFKGPIYTYYAANTGITKTFGEAGKGLIRLVHEGPLNPPASDRMAQYWKDFKAKNPDYDITQARITNVLEMLAKAINEAGSADDVIAVANALEGMEHDSIWGGKIMMRADDHQAIQDVHISVHTDEGIEHDADNSGFGLLVESSVTMASADVGSSCKMKRP